MNRGMSTGLSFLFIRQWNPSKVTTSETAKNGQLRGVPFTIKQIGKHFGHFRGSVSL